MMPYIGAIIFGLLILVLVVLVVMFLFYMNNWLCFEKLPRCWCLQNNYDELESLPATVDEQQETDSDEMEVVYAAKEDDAVTIAAEDFGKGAGASRGDDGDRSDNSDEIIKKFGTLVSKFHYDIINNTLSVDIIAVQYLPLKIQGGPTHYQLYIKVFNDNGQTLQKWHSPLFKVAKDARTKILQSQFKGEVTMQYTDMSQKDVSTTAVRIRLYGCERKRRDKLLSETTIGLASLNLASSQTYRIRLEKRGEIRLITTEDVEMEDENDYTTVAAKKIQIKVEEIVGNNTELLTGLAYNKVTGRLTVEIVKGNAFKDPLSREERLPNAFVKITLCAKNCQVIAKSKTTVRNSQANPLFKEKFIFQVPQIQLPEISIIIGVYHKKTVHRRELIGWFSIGYHSTGEEAKSHWKSMETYSGQIAYQWHLLQKNTTSKHGLPGAD